ncbi:MAG: type II secretion system protein [Gammaproteobacteria bacterium]
MRPRQAGFTYIGLLVAVVILGIALAGIGRVWRTQAQREREQELLFIGREFQAAIGSYYSSGGHQYPQSIDDLLEDKRWPEPRHHLRRLYADPMTGAPDWTLLQAAGAGIMGIASSSQQEPIKKSGFPKDEEAFADAKSYNDWQFTYVPHYGWRRHAASAPPASD